MDAIRNVRNRDLLGGAIRIHVVPLAPSDLAIEFGNTICGASQSQAKYCHCKLFRWVIRVYTTERHQLVVRDSQTVSERMHAGHEQFWRESIMTGWYWRVRGKDALGADFFTRLVE